jgi:thiol-disulfide isomerase/thioredoxin
MKYLMALLLVISSSAFSLEEGGTIPEFALTGMDGKATSSSAQVGKTKLTYVDFWATWCGPCKQSFPFMNELVKEFGGKGLTITAISLDEETDEIPKFLKDVPADFNIFYGDAAEIGDKVQPPGMPSSALVDQSGKIIALHKGYSDKIAQQVKAEIAAILK